MPPHALLTALILDARADLQSWPTCAAHLIDAAREHAAGLLGDHQQIPRMSAELLDNTQELYQALNAEWSRLRIELGEPGILDAVRADLALARIGYREALAGLDFASDPSALVVARERLAKARGASLALAQRAMPEAGPVPISGERARAEALGVYGVGQVANR